MARPEPVLIFGQYENSYRLESLWTPDGGRRDIPGSLASRKLATVKVPAQPAS